MTSIGFAALAPATVSGAVRPRPDSAAENSDQNSFSELLVASGEPNALGAQQGTPADEVLEQRVERAGYPSLAVDPDDTGMNGQPSPVGTVELLMPSAALPTIPHQVTIVPSPEQIAGQWSGACPLHVPEFPRGIRKEPATAATADSQGMQRMQLAGWEPAQHGAAALQYEPLGTVRDRRGDTGTTGGAIRQSRALAPVSVRTETHLPAAALAVAAPGSIMPSSVSSESAIVSIERNSGLAGVPDRDGASSAEVSLVVPEASTVPVQIADQLVSSLAMRSGSPTALQESAPPISVGGRGPIAAAGGDVVKALRFDLHPGDLGEVHVRVSLVRNELRVQLRFSTEKAAGVANADRHALMQALADNGLAIGQLLITADPTTSVDLAVREKDAELGHPNPGNSTPSGGGTGRDRRAQPEASRGDVASLRPVSEPGSVDETKAGIFI